jgi:hypothetical protein
MFTYKNCAILAWSIYCVAVAATGLVVILVLACVSERYIFKVQSPPGVALVRERPGARHFSWRTRLAYYMDCKSLYREAFDNVSKES